MDKIGSEGWKNSGAIPESVSEGEGGGYDLVSVSVSANVIV